MFIHKDSIKAQLDTLVEGYWGTINIDLEVYDNDKSKIEIVNKPPFVSYDLVRLGVDSYNFYLNKERVVKFMLANPDKKIAFKPDSTALDKVWEWSIIIRNQANVGDTLFLNTVVIRQ